MTRNTALANNLTKSNASHKQTEPGLSQYEDMYF